MLLRARNCLAATGGLELSIDDVLEGPDAHSRRLEPNSKLEAIENALAIANTTNGLHSPRGLQRI